MLAYANAMFLDILHEDGLVVSAKGLGHEEVFYSLLKVYSDPGNLVLVMGTNDEEEAYFQSRLEQDSSVKYPSKRVTSEYSTSDRQKLYLNGGVLFVTTRILVVDMLTERIPFHLVTGILVYRAHKSMESCQEAFVLRLYRQNNKTGFVKAFSGSPVAFTTSFCQVSRVMRNLFVRNLYLWPRFHATVVDTLKNNTPEVTELHIDMTQAMLTIQTALLDLMSFTLQELKRLNPSLAASRNGEDDNLSVENAMSRSFHKTLQQELDPIWHQLSWRTKQLVSDMKTLRSILMHLTHYDCITFHTYVSALRTTENAMRSGGWMILDSAETLFMTARARIFGPESGTKKSKVESEQKKFDFEQTPKWEALKEILKEIKDEVNKYKQEDEVIPSEKVLIMTSDERVCQQVQDFLTIGSEALLIRMFNKSSLAERYGFLPGDCGAKKEVKDKGKGKKSSNQEETVLSIIESPVTIVQSMHIGSFALNVLINELSPRYVIMYDAEIGVVRQLEVFQANHPEFRLKVFFMMYGQSVEEQAFLSSLRREKEAMEYLIKEKATMVIPEEREGRNDDNLDLMRGSAQEVNNTRKGGAEKQQQVAKVIVDMREFRSELPSLLHKRGINIEPVTLEVGDYILTPDICVERKSISDLIGSLNGGRLYNQATSMTRSYKRPMLLIEFDHNKPFALQGKYYLSRDIASSDLVARLQLLTIHFPKLRILWSPSPHATAELFEELKRGRPEPDAATAAAVSIDNHMDNEDFNAEKYNPSIHDFLSKLPGVTTRNVYALLNRVDSFVELLELDIDALEELLGSKQCAVDLHESLHRTAKPPESGKETAGKAGTKARKGSRFKTVKGKK